MKKITALPAAPLAFADQKAVEQALSQKLKHYYDQMAQQEVPKHLLDLLDELDAASKPDKR